MSKIYEALIQAGKRSASRAAGLRSHGHEQPALLRLTHQDNRVQWKIITAVATVILVFGVLVVVIANQFMGRALRSENDQRALAIATNLSDAAAGPVMEKNILAIYVLVTKYARLNNAAYAFIEDGNGQVVAQSIKPFPPELNQTLTADARKEINRRTVTLGGKTAYETRVPILEGQLGAVHLGIWAEGVKNEISAARLPVIGIMTLVLLLAVSVAVLLVRAIVAPTHGPIESPVEVSASEFKSSLENRVAR